MIVDYNLARDCIRDILDRQLEKQGEVPSHVVLLGETAAMSHGIRPLANSVDFFATDCDYEIVVRVEAEIRKSLGVEFSINVTTTEMLYGLFLLRDIGASPEIDRLQLGNTTVQIKRLSLVDLAISKVALGRPEDLQNLSSIRPRVSESDLILRFNAIHRTLVDRATQPVLADQFVLFVAGGMGLERECDIIERLTVPDLVKAMLLEMRHAE
ncbi:hypothetical protein [Mesorhizobium sp. SP-1A]|uniref:hypothetical protein n=1 Tax=Mesorhizobium sp. SP-1A TaxID=3077840 RepID=UPI0028F6D8C7|nr:hypothetical protein [Mesorhizobium sp. SP-1A]